MTSMNERTAVGTSSKPAPDHDAALGEAWLVREELPSSLTAAEVALLFRDDQRPFALIGNWGGGAIIGSAPLRVAGADDDPFSIVTELPVAKDGIHGAIGGGWFGYFGYKLGGRIEDLPRVPHRPIPLPEFSLAYYDHLLHYDKNHQVWCFEALWTPQRATVLRSRLELFRDRLAESAERQRDYRIGGFAPPDGKADHQAGVRRVIEHIFEGDVFQVNLCMRLEASFSGDPLDVFCAGVQRLKPPYAAFIGDPSSAIASFSPELFLRRVGRQVFTSPIKGTISCLSSHEASEQVRKLLESDKDRAENVMIVDLMRNDLGRVCKPGSVKVPSLCRAEAHPGLWHLVSDVVGELRDDVDDAALLRATFPPGSVTGAPKIRAMERIAELEGSAREAYTGSVGYVSPLAGVELNVVIRTLEFAGGRVWLGVGGGIVSDSDPQAETEECFTKAVPLLRAIGASLDGHFRPPSQGSIATNELRPDVRRGLIETLLVVRGVAVERDAHLDRLSASVDALYQESLPVGILGEVQLAAGKCRDISRLRISVSPRERGHVAWSIDAEAVDHSIIQASGEGSELVPVRVGGGLGPHKWRDRDRLAELAARHGLAKSQELLMIDRNGDVLESERGNLFAVVDGCLLTSPSDGRILPGVTRARVLSIAGRLGMAALVESQALDRLTEADEVFLTSAIRGIVPVISCRGNGRWPSGPITLRLKNELAELWLQRASL